MGVTRNSTNSLIWTRPSFRFVLKGFAKSREWWGFSVFIYIFSHISDILDVGEGSVEMGNIHNCIFSSLSQSDIALK